MSEFTDKTTYYIAGPMTGKPGFNYGAFELADEILVSMGIAGILNPINACEYCSHDDEPGQHDWDWYMRSALRMVADADVILTLPGSDESEGAKLEAYVGKKLGVPVLSFVEFIKSYQPIYPTTSESLVGLEDVSEGDLDD